MSVRSKVAKKPRLVLAACAAVVTLALQKAIDLHRQEDYRLAVMEVVSLPDTLAYIHSGVADSHGNFYLLQPSPPLLLFHDPSSEDLSHLGRIGKGPGEYQFLAGLGVRGDDVWTSDPVLRRVTIYDRNGRTKRTLGITTQPVADRFAPGLVAGWLEDGSFLVNVEAYARSVAAGRVDKVPVLKVDLDGTVTDTLFWRNVDHWSSEVQVEPDGPASYGHQPFDDGTLWATSGDNKYIFLIDRGVDETSKTYVVTKIAQGGTRVWSRRFAYEPQRISSELIDSAVASRARRMSLLRKYDPAKLDRAIRASLFLPQVLPPVTEAVSAGDGIWLRQPWISGGDRWSMIDGNGDVRGVLHATHGLRILWTDGSIVWGTTVDEDGLPSLKSYRVVTR